MTELDLLIKNANVVDGSGKPVYKASIGIKGDKVSSVGEVKGDAKKTIEAKGLTAVPGFIDAHSHADRSVQFFPQCESYLFQGVTTFVGGQCGMSMAPIGDMINLPGIAQEHGGIIRHGAKILYAIAESTVPKVSLIIRKSYGGSFIAMSSKALGYDRVLAYPTAEIAVMGAEGAANIIFRREIKAAENPEEKRLEKIEEFKQTVMNPFIAAGLGYVDDIIEPRYTRIEMIRSLEMIVRKQEERPAKKHGNIPL